MTSRLSTRSPRATLLTAFLVLVVPWVAFISEDGGSIFADGCTFSKTLVVYSGGQTDTSVKEMNDGLWPGLVKSGQRELNLAFGDIQTLYLETDAGGLFEEEEHHAYVEEWLAENIRVNIY